MDKILDKSKIRAGMEDSVRLRAENEMREDTIDLLELLFVLLSRWKMILLVMISCTGIACLYNVCLVKPSYQAKAQIYITNTDQMIDIQNVQLSAALTVDYEEILRSFTVLQKVIDDMELDIDYEKLSSMITITNPRDSHILKIYVVTGDPQFSMDVANTILKYGIDQIYRIVGNDEPTIIDSAVEKTTKVVKTSIVKAGMMGAMLGFVLVCGIIVLQFLLDMTFKTEDEIENYMNLPVIAVIPVYAEEVKEPGGFSKKRRRDRNVRKDHCTQNNKTGFSGK